MKKTLTQRIEEAIEELRNEAGPDDFGFNEYDGFIVGCVGFYGHNRIRNWELNMKRWKKALVEEAKKEYPGYKPILSDDTETLTYSPDEFLEDGWNVYFLAFVKE